MQLTNTISAREMQRNYKKIFDRVKRTKEPVIVISNNKPQAAIVSLDVIADYQRERDFTFLKEIWAKNKNADSKKAMKDITEVVEEVRQRMYEERKKTSRS